MNDKISFQLILNENALIQKQLTDTKNRVIIFLLASSLIEIFWAIEIFNFEIIYDLRIIFTIPLILNILSWLIYAMQYLTPSLFNRRRYFDMDLKESDSIEEHRVMRRNQLLNYSLYRQAAIERVIIPLITFQFISMSAIFVFLRIIR